MPDAVDVTDATLLFAAGVLSLVTVGVPLAVPLALAISSLTRYIVHRSRDCQPG